MGRKISTAGVCPWCMSAINSGAVACKSCGASESDSWEQLGAWRFSIIGLVMFLFAVPAIGIIIFFPMAGLILMALGIGAVIVIRSLMKRRKSWVAAGGGRVL